MPVELDELFAAVVEARTPIEADLVAALAGERPPYELLEAFRRASVPLSCALIQRADLQAIARATWRARLYGGCPVVASLDASSAVRKVDAAAPETARGPLWSRESIEQLFATRTRATVGDVVAWTGELHRLRDRDRQARQALKFAAFALAGWE